MKNVAHDGFKFPMTITKAYDEQNTNGEITKMIIKGVASNTRRDKENHQVTFEGLESIKTAIENGIIDEDGEWSPVPLRSGHREEWEDKLGDIVKAEIDDDENLWIVAELDIDSSKARDLFIKVSKGNASGRKPQLGLSVKGKATKYRFGVDPESSQRVTFLEKLTIDEVSVTSKPKNPTPYPLAIYKSLLPLEESMKNVTETPETDQIAQAIEKAQEIANNQAAPVQVPDQPAEVQAVANPTTEHSETMQEQAAEQAEEVIQRDPEVPPGYALHPHSQAAEQAQAQANADAGVVTETVVQEVSQTEPDAVARVSETLNTLVAAIDQLRTEVEALQNQNVQKALPDAEATSVTLAADNDMENRVTLAVTKAFSDELNKLGLGTLVNDIQVVKSQLEELQAQPFDRSIAVSKAKTEDESDPYVRMRRLVENGLDPIAAATRTAYNK